MGSIRSYFNYAKLIFEENKIRFKFLFKSFLLAIKYKKIRTQNRCFKKIPIIIISFNQLLYLKKLIGFLTKCGYKNIVIIDNASTYPPLIEYLKDLEKVCTIHRQTENYGHLVFWEKKELYEEYAKGYYVVTDADVVPDDFCPSDFLGYFKSLLDKNHKISKVGFSLRLDNIPETNPNKKTILEWEKKYWTHKVDEDNYSADIDTTFALYRPKYFKLDQENFMRAIRTKSPYLATHGGWIIDKDNFTEEQKYYMQTANESSSWKLDSDGNLNNPVYL